MNKTLIEHLRLTRKNPNRTDEECLSKYQRERGEELKLKITKLIIQSHENSSTFR